MPDREITTVDRMGVVMARFPSVASVLTLRRDKSFGIMGDANGREPGTTIPLTVAGGRLAGPAKRGVAGKRSALRRTYPQVSQRIAAALLGQLKRTGAFLFPGPASRGTIPSALKVRAPES